MPQRPGGVAFYCDGVNTTEVHSSKCQHCGCFTEYPSKRVMFDYVDICRNCNGIICLREECKNCTPLMKKIERYEEEAYRRAQNSKVMGS